MHNKVNNFFSSKVLKVVIKSRFSQNEYECAKREANILIEHPNRYFIKCEGFFEEIFKGNRCFMILYEYCPVINFIF